MNVKNVEVDLLLLIERGIRPSCTWHFVLIKTQAIDSRWTHVAPEHQARSIDWSLQYIRSTEYRPSLALAGLPMFSQTALQINAVGQELHPESLTYQFANPRNPNKYLWGSNIKWTFWRLTFLFPIHNASQRTKVRSVLLSWYQLYLREVNVWRYLIWHHVLHYTSDFSNIQDYKIYTPA